MSSKMNTKTSDASPAIVDDNETASVEGQKKSCASPFVDSESHTKTSDASPFASVGGQKSCAFPFVDDISSFLSDFTSKYKNNELSDDDLDSFANVAAKIDDMRKKKKLAAQGSEGEDPNGHDLLVRLDEIFNFEDMTKAELERIVMMTLPLLVELHKAVTNKTNTMSDARGIVQSYMEFRGNQIQGFFIKHEARKNKMARKLPPRSSLKPHALSVNVVNNFQGQSLKLDSKPSVSFDSNTNRKKKNTTNDDTPCKRKRSARVAARAALKN